MEGLFHAFDLHHPDSLSHLLYKLPKPTLINKLLTFLPSFKSTVSPSNLSLSLSLSLRLLPRMAAVLALFVIFATVSSTVTSDPDMLQDICVADLTSGVKLNGFPCMNAANVSAADFFFDGLAKPGLTNNSMGSLVTAANVQKIPGLNTLGVSLSRIDYAPGGVNPPHTHPRATEIVFVLDGQLDVGFITTANVLVSKTITKGQIFVFPRGLVHFQKNNGGVPAAVIAAFNSQLPGTQSIAATLFGASPPVPDNVLTKAFQIGTKEVKKIKSRFAPKM